MGLIHVVAADWLKPSSCSELGQLPWPQEGGSAFFSRCRAWAERDGVCFVLFCSFVFKQNKNSRQGGDCSTGLHGTTLHAD